MSITTIKSQLPHSNYLNLVEQLYGNSEAASKYRSDIEDGLNFVLNNDQMQTRFFSFLKEDELVGHIALILNPNGEAFFGFFELSDTELFSTVWQTLADEARQLKLKTVFGPVNGSVWHAYRVIDYSNGVPFFYSEPMTAMHYKDLFQSLKPVKELNYYSAYRTNYEAILKATTPSVRLISEQGIQIRKEEFSMDLLDKIYELASAIFSQNPGYVQLSPTDFLKLYSNKGQQDAKPLIYTAWKDEKCIGFSYNIHFNDALIMKTIGVDPELQEKGIGNAMVNQVHKYAAENSIAKVIYALIRSDNKVKHFPKDDTTVFRTYSAYLFEI